MSYPHRTLCQVLEEMRSCYKTRNFSSLLGLIEEVQTLGNRMEAGLGEQKDYESWHRRAKAERDEYRRLLALVNGLRREAGEPEKEEYTWP